MAKETIKVVQIDTKPAQTSIKDLRKALKEYKDQMANLEEGSDAFLKLAKNAGDVKHQIDEINESVRGASADFGDMVGNITNVAAGITGAFQAVAGGLQAIGLESEAVDQAIAKMQGLMAVTQGLAAIDDGIKSFDKLTASLGKAGATLNTFVKGLSSMAVPLAIVAALTAGFVKLKSALDGTKSSLEAKAEAQSRFNTELQKELEIRKRAGYSEEELIVFEMEKLRLRQEELKKENELLEEQHEAAKREAEENARIASSMQGMAGNTDAAGAALGELLSVSGKYQAQIKENNKEIDESITKYKELEQQLEIIYKARELAAKKMPSADIGGTGVSSSSESIAESIDAIYNRIRHTTNQIQQAYNNLQFERVYTKLIYNQDAQAKLKELYEVSDDLLTISNKVNNTRDNGVREGIKTLKDLLKLRGDEISLEKDILQIHKRQKEEREAQYEQSKKATKAALDAYNALVERDKAGEQGLGRQIAEALELQFNLEQETADLELEVNNLTQAWIEQGMRVDDLKQKYAELSFNIKEIEDLENIRLMNEQFEILQNTVSLLGESTLGLSGAWGNVIADMQKFSNILGKTIIEGGEDAWQGYLTAAANAAQGVGSIMNALSDEQDSNTKKGFENQKKFQISATIVNMLAGVMAAWSSAMSLPTPFNIIAASTNTAATIALGAAQIAKIKKQNFSDTSDTGGNAAASSSALASTLLAPTQYSSAVQGASTESAIKDTRVYVLESDITGTIGKVQVQEAENIY